MQDRGYVCLLESLPTVLVACRAADAGFGCGAALARIQHQHAVHAQLLNCTTEATGEQKSNQLCAWKHMHSMYAQLQCCTVQMVTECLQA